MKCMEQRRTVEIELAGEIAARGWIGVTIPRAYGGMGLGHVAKTVIIEELARVSGAMGAMAQASQLGVAKVLHFGTAEQKRRWLPRFASGELLPTIAVTEPGSGGHVLGMASTAARDGDGSRAQRDQVLRRQLAHRRTCTASSPGPARARAG